jgi:hypothetical protein
MSMMPARAATMLAAMSIKAEPLGAYFASEWVGIDGDVNRAKLAQAGTTEQSVSGICQ